MIVRAYKSIASAKSAIRTNGLQGMSYDIIKHPADREFPSGSYHPVFYADGYEEAEQDRSFIRALKFSAQKYPSKELGRNQTVVFSHRAKD